MSYETYWCLGNKMYDKNEVTIIQVFPKILPELSIDEIDDLQKTKWAIKIMTGDRFYINEIGKMESLDLFNFEHSIKFPLSPCYRSGREGKISWYVMELLPNKIEHSSFSIKKNISIFVNQIINFLEWLHVEKNKVHGDLKSDNIVSNIFTNKYKIIDFENITRIKETTCEEDLPNGYYYYSQGCDYDKPYYSYRCDLQIFGYILWNIVRDEHNEYHLLEWQHKATRRYVKELEKNEFYYIQKVKDLEEQTTEKPDCIKKYFEIISQLDWNEQTPKKELYQEIRDLFKDVHLQVINPL